VELELKNRITASMGGANFFIFNQLKDKR